MPKIFNPPPNWPKPPVGWQPPAQWRPNPAWGPVPSGWVLWIDAPTASPVTADQAEAATHHQQRIFISYRRSDCQPQANGLFDGLTHRVKSASIFMDIDSIPPGVDFEQHIRDEINICDVVLVLIGDNWLDARPGTDRRRIDEPEDFVRLEIENALASPRCRVIPVLVEGAEMPSLAELPESIRRLARINAIELSDRRWTADLERLAATVERIGRDRPSRKLSASNPAITNTHQAATQRSPVVSSPGFEHTKSRSARSTHVEAPKVELAENGLKPTSTSVPAQEQRQIPRKFDNRGRSAPSTLTNGRTTSIGWLMIIIPTFSFGLASFVPSLWAASRTQADPAFRRRMFIWSTALGVLSIGAFAVVGGSASGSALSAIGVSFWFGAIVAATVLAVRHRKSGIELPGISEELARRRRREQYRALIRSDPNLARGMGVGRPDLPRDYDDGGLIDLNAVSVEVLSHFAAIPIDEAQGIVDLRKRAHRLSKIEDVTAQVDLDQPWVDRLKEVAVFL